MTAVTIQELTTGAVNGTGVFDKLMHAAKAHLEQEFLQSRIKGPEYSQVYLASLTQVLQTSVQFLAINQKIDLETQLLQAQIDLTNAQKDLVLAQIDGLDADRDLKEAQAAQVRAETLNVPLQGDQIRAQTALAEAQLLNVPLQGEQIQAQTALVAQQKLNAVQEQLNLVAQECLLRSQFDASQATVLNTGAQTDLLKQKIVSEKAQTMELGVDDNSVLGRQKNLYQAQIAGFTRDAENKATKLMLDTWNARRMTDDATVADGTNKLNDATIGRFVDKLAAGIGA